MRSRRRKCFTSRTSLCHILWCNSIKGKEWFSWTTLWWWDGRRRPPLFRLKAGFYSEIDLCKFSNWSNLQPFRIFCTRSSRGCPISKRNSALPRGLHWYNYNQQQIYLHPKPIMNAFIVWFCRSENFGWGREAHFPHDTRGPHDLRLQLDRRKHCTIPWQLTKLIQPEHVLSRSYSRTLECSCKFWQPGQWQVSSKVCTWLFRFQLLPARNLSSVKSCLPCLTGKNRLWLECNPSLGGVPIWSACQCY